jgi:hypothetical protein
MEGGALDKTEPLGGVEGGALDKTEPLGGVEGGALDKTEPLGGVKGGALDKTEPLGGVEGTALHKKTNPALVAPEGRAGAAEIEPCLTGIELCVSESISSSRTVLSSQWMQVGA